MYLRVFLFALAILLIFPAATIVVTDPYQVWHDHWLGKDVYSTNQRYQNPGLIRRYLECADCEDTAVIIGTSVTENTTATDFREATGYPHVLRLIAEGGYPIEQHLTLKRALASGRVKVVFWEIYRNYVGPDYDQFASKVSFPVYLYTPQIQDDLPYLLNHDVFRDGIRNALGITTWTENLDSINSWQDEAVADGRWANWNDPRHLAQQTAKKRADAAAWPGQHPDWNQPVPVFEEFILPIVNAYSDVRFIFFTPPVSLLRHGEDLGESLSAQLALRKKLAALATGRTNIELYSFDDYEPLVGDMAYYKDTGHFIQAVNRWMLERMMAKDTRFALTDDNVVERGERLWTMTAEYIPFSSCVDSRDSCGQFHLDNSEK